MITIKALLIIASIVFDPKQGLFVYPVNNVSNIFVAGSRKEFSSRLCNQSASAMLGAVDGYISRMVIPSLVNYGGAKGITKLEELADKDWAEYVGTNRWGDAVFNHSLSGDTFVPFGYYAPEIFYATNRYYASTNYNFIAAPQLTTYGRIRKINNVVDEVVLGDAGSNDGDPRPIFIGGFETSFNGRPSLHWLCNDVGKYNTYSKMTKAPQEPKWEEKWTEFDPFRKGYALQICELAKTNFLGAWKHSTLGIACDFTLLLPLHSQEFFDAAKDGDDWPGGIQLFWEHLGNAFMAGETNISARAIANNYASVADFMNEVSPDSNIDYTTFTNRPTKRIWKERFAFANSLISLNNRSLIPFDYFYVDRYSDEYSITNYYDFSTISAWMNPSYALHHEKYNGKIRAELTMNLDPSKFFTIIKNNYTEDGDANLPPYYCPLILDDYSENYFYYTNQLNSTTNYFPDLEVPVMAWVDKSGYFEINLRGGVDVKLGDIFTSIENETSDSEWKDVIIRTGTTVDPDGYTHSISLNGGGSFTTYSPPTSTNWNVVISIFYNSDYYGTQFNKLGDAVRAPYGPINTSTGYYHSCSYLPPEAHPMMNNFIKDVSLNTFVFIAVSTNINQISGVASGGLLSPGQMFTPPKDPTNPFYDPPKKDMWFFAGMRYLCEDVRTRSEVESYLMTLYDNAVDYMNNVHDDLPSASKGSASNISSEELKSILESKITENILSLSFVQDGSSNGGETGYEAKGGVIRRKSDKVEISKWEDIVIDSYSCSGMRGFSIDENNPARRSSAKMYMEAPHAIVEWDFPCMNYKYDGEK